MNSAELVNMLIDREFTVMFATRSVAFLEGYAGADRRFSVPVDGDALAILRAAVS